MLEIWCEKNLWWEQSAFITWQNLPVLGAQVTSGYRWDVVAFLTFKTHRKYIFCQGCWVSDQFCIQSFSSIWILSELYLAITAVSFHLLLMMILYGLPARIQYGFKTYVLVLSSMRLISWKRVMLMTQVPFWKILGFSTRQEKHTLSVDWTVEKTHLYAANMQI